MQFKIKTTTFPKYIIAFKSVDKIDLISKMLEEAIREIKDVKTRVDDIHILFRPTKEKKTRKQIHDDEIAAMVAEYKVNMLLMKDHD